jgi:hypothetical protein
MLTCFAPIAETVGTSSAARRVPNGSSQPPLSPRVTGICAKGAGRTIVDASPLDPGTRSRSASMGLSAVTTTVKEAGGVAAKGAEHPPARLMAPAIRRDASPSASRGHGLGTPERAAPNSQALGNKPPSAATSTLSVLRCKGQERGYPSTCAARVIPRAPVVPGGPAGLSSRT